MSEFCVLMCAVKMCVCVLYLSFSFSLFHSHTCSFSLSPPSLPRFLSGCPLHLSCPFPFLPATALPRSEEQNPRRRHLRHDCAHLQHSANRSAARHSRGWPCKAHIEHDGVYFCFYVCAHVCLCLFIWVHVFLSICLDAFLFMNVRKQSAKLQAVPLQSTKHGELFIFIETT